MDRLAYWLYRAAGALLGLLPLRVVFAIGQGAGLFAWVVGVSYRQLARRNMEIAFGREQSPAEIDALVRKHFISLGANVFAGFRLARMSREEIRAVIEVDGVEEFARLVQSGRGVVSIVTHLGNWELLSLTSPIIFPCPSGSIYQRLGNPFIDAEVRAQRARLGMSLFERKEGFQDAIKMLREGGTVGVLVDQHAGDAGVWVPFFGRLASTSSLAAMLALRTGAAAMTVTAHTIGPARWRVSIGAPIESTQRRDPLALTAEINRAVERLIQLKPEDWFWVHNRWKTPKPKFLLATYKRGVSTADPAALQPFRVVVRASNWLGDAVMSVPAVRAINRGRPDLRLAILTPAKLADLWRSVPEVDDVIAIEQGEGVFAVARKLRAGRFEAAIAFPNSIRTALEPWLAGIPRRVGYPGHRRGWLLNQIFREKKKKKPEPPRHQVNDYLRLAEFIGAEIEAETAVQRPPRGDGAPLKIGVVPGAEYGPAKRWPAERFREAMDSFAPAGGCHWTIFGVAKDAEVAAAITKDFTGNLTNRVGQTTLRELIEELRTCDALLTNDTGTMHLAALLGVPVVAIFGSTEPSLTGPLGNQHRVLRQHVECSPCFLRECPIDFRCMTSVTVEQAVAALREVCEAGAAIK
jgi:lipopolysaccharide heptosyltransferase II